MSLQELTEFIRRYLPVVIVTLLLTGGAFWLGFDRLYENRLEERDSRIRALERQVQELRANVQPIATATPIPTATPTPTLIPIATLTPTAAPAPTVTPVPPTPICWVQVEACLELNLVSGTRQRKCPSKENGKINLASSDIEDLQNLSGQAILSGSTLGCHLNWEGRTETTTPWKSINAQTSSHSFSIALPNGVTTVDLRLTVNGKEPKLFAITIS